MNDTVFTFYLKDGKTFESNDLVNFFEDDVYKNVEFYVDSDGYYMGESGNVEITLNDDDEPYFEYSKNSQGEWSESKFDEYEINISEKFINFIKENVSNINGNGNVAAINFKGDLILTDEDEILLTELEESILDEINNINPEIPNDGLLEDNDTLTFTTDDGPNSIEGVRFNDNKLLVGVTHRYTEYR